MVRPVQFGRGMGETLTLADELRLPRPGVIVTHAPTTVESMCAHRLREAIRALGALRARQVPALELALALGRPLPAARLRGLEDTLALADAAIAHGEALGGLRPNDELATLTAIAASARDTIRPRLRALAAAQPVDLAAYLDLYAMGI
jgi:hypothetical protein